MRQRVVAFVAWLPLILVPVSEALAEFRPPLGLDLYRPIPEDNPLPSKK